MKLSNAPSSPGRASALCLVGLVKFTLFLNGSTNWSILASDLHSERKRTRNSIGLIFANYLTRSVTNSRFNFLQIVPYLADFLTHGICHLSNRQILNPSQKKNLFLIFTQSRQN